LTKVKSGAILVIEVKKNFQKPRKMINHFVTGKNKNKNKNKNKKMKNSIITSTELGFNHVGWRYYNEIKKKAMSEDFSVQSLALSLSIAFFIVSVAALGLNFLYYSVLN